MKTFCLRAGKAVEKDVAGTGGKNNHDRFLFCFLEFVAAGGDKDIGWVNRLHVYCLLMAGYFEKPIPVQALQSKKLLARSILRACAPKVRFAFDQPAFCLLQLACYMG
jgi:hypothetical protein